MKTVTYVIGVLLYLISDAPGQTHSASPGEEKLSLILYDDLQNTALSKEGVKEGKNRLTSNWKERTGSSFCICSTLMLPLVAVLCLKCIS